MTVVKIKKRAKRCVMKKKLNLKIIKTQLKLSKK